MISKAEEKVENFFLPKSLRDFIELIVNSCSEQKTGLYDKFCLMTSNGDNETYKLQIVKEYLSPIIRMADVYKSGISDLDDFVGQGVLSVIETCQFIKDNWKRKFYCYDEYGLHRTFINNIVFSMSELRHKSRNLFSIPKLLVKASSVSRKINNLEGLLGRNHSDLSMVRRLNCEKRKFHSYAVSSRWPPHVLKKRVDEISTARSRLWEELRIKQLNSSVENRVFLCLEMIRILTKEELEAVLMKSQGKKLPEIDEHLNENGNGNGDGNGRRIKAERVLHGARIKIRGLLKEYGG